MSQSWDKDRIDGIRSSIKATLAIWPYSECGIPLNLIHERFGKYIVKEEFKPMHWFARLELGNEVRLVNYYWVR